MKLKITVWTGADRIGDESSKLGMVDGGSLGCNWPLKTGSASRMRRKTCPTIRSAPSHEDNIVARRVAADESSNGASIMLMKLPMCLDIEKKNTELYRFFLRKYSGRLGLNFSRFSFVYRLPACPPKCQLLNNEPQSTRTTEIPKCNLHMSTFAYTFTLFMWPAPPPEKLGVSWHLNSFRALFTLPPAKDTFDPELIYLKTL